MTKAKMYQQMKRMVKLPGQTCVEGPADMAEAKEWLSMVVVDLLCAAEVLSNSPCKPLQRPVLLKATTSLVGLAPLDTTELHLATSKVTGEISLLQAKPPKTNNKVAWAASKVNKEAFNRVIATVVP